MHTSPLISVCINCYNAEDTIRPTLQSVLDQTYTHLQIIVVDDCSTDSTRDILRQFNDERIECVFLPENGHISNANNEALRRVRGEFVAHLDADDCWVPEFVEKQLAFLQEHPAYGACFSVAKMVDEQGDPVEDHRFRAENRNRAELLRHFLTVGNYLNHSSMFARREIIDRVGEHDVTLLYHHDFDYWIRMAMLCDIYISPEKLVVYRLSAGSNSALPEKKLAAHFYETGQITYRAVCECPNDLFAKAFADRLRLQGEHTPEQMELEKAFLLCELFANLPQNPVLGLRRLSELLRDKQYAAIARRDFHFTVHDLYKLEQTTVYFNEITHNALVRHATTLETEFRASLQRGEALSAECDRLRAELNSTRAYADTVVADRDHLREYTDAVLADREDLRNHIQTLAGEHAAQTTRADLAEQQLALTYGSFSWKITKPLRALKRLFHR